MTAAAVAAAIALGLTVGLLGGAAASTALGGQGDHLPSQHRLSAAAAALARKTHGAPIVTIVAQSRSRSIPLYRHPGASPYRFLGPLAYSYDTRPVFRVLSNQGSWLHVSLPTRPGTATAWIRLRDVRLTQTGYRVTVRLRAHRLLVQDDGRRVLGAPIAVGKALTPTPSGTYFIAYVLQTGDPNSFFGPYAFGLSAYSHVLTSFAGGDGEIGLHGTSEPWLLGQSVSHGCIRIRNSVITHLVHILPLGTPVRIQR